MSKTSFPGHLLRDRREERGLTLRQVHEHIRVPVEYVRALEDGALDKLPSYTYSAGFLGSYCQLLELAPEPFQVEFRSATQRRQVKQQQPASCERTGNRSVMDRIPQPAWLTEVLAWGTICALIALGWITYAVVMQPFAQNPDGGVQAGQISIEPPVLPLGEDSEQSGF